MLAKIRITPRAFEDLNEIKEYLFQNSDSAELKILSKIVSDIESLSEFPKKGVLLTSRIEIITKYRYLNSGSYIIFYIYDNEIVSIQRVLHGRRDYLKVLFKNK